MATGSNLINTSATGQPTNNEDRPFSFAIGTQIFLNPSDDPTDAVVSFKADANLLAGSSRVEHQTFLSDFQLTQS